MGPFLASMLYSYALIAYDLFIAGVIAGLGTLLYSAILGVMMVYDKFRYGSFTAHA
jgi:hypothetical protein